LGLDGNGGESYVEGVGKENPYIEIKNTLFEKKGLYYERKSS
jgi:hypothetical protein